MISLHFLLNLATVLSVLLIYITPHPIYAVLLLVLLFCEASATLFLFNIEFLSLTLILVYVGAIAVLFLFVVMMLNIKLGQQFMLKQFILFLSFAVITIGMLFLILNNTIVNLNFFEIDVNNFKIFKVNVFDSLNNLELIGQFTFNEYAICLVVVGLLLLVPLIGSIVLTLNCESIKKSNISLRQLSRSSTTLAFFK